MVEARGVKRSRGELPVCPRCGLPYNYVERNRVGERVYLYAVHFEEAVVDGKVRKRRRRCYLGPAGAYEYVSKLHFREGLLLYGLAVEDRAVRYLESLARSIYYMVSRADPATRVSLVDGLERAKKWIEEALKLISQSYSSPASRPAISESEVDSKPEEV
jgi:hypothetical protein